MLGVINNIRLEAMATVVPRNRVPVTEKLKNIMTPKRAKRVIAGTGIEEVCVAEDGVCASDFCVSAAQRLFDEGLVKREDIGAVVFVTQRPDYPIPATAYSIQSRLRLGSDVMAFDVNCSCPGFVYGIHIAGSMLSNLSKKVLLCCGDVRFFNPQGSSFSPIMGDGGAATVIGRTMQSDSRKVYFNIDSYGERMKSLYEPRGAARAHKRTDTEGNLIVEPENYAIMDGMAITNFTLNEVPQNIENLLKYIDCSPKDMDIAFVHQANGLIVKSLAEKLDVPQEKMPFQCAHIGNADMASIPICMTEWKKNGNDFTKFHRALISGFGAGLSVASVIMDISDIKVLETGEM